MCHITVSWSKSVTQWSRRVVVVQFAFLRLPDTSFHGGPVLAIAIAAFAALAPWTRHRSGVFWRFRKSWGSRRCQSDDFLLFLAFRLVPSPHFTRSIWLGAIFSTQDTSCGRCTSARVIPGGPPPLFSTDAMRNPSQRQSGGSSSSSATS